MSTQQDAGSGRHIVRALHILDSLADRAARKGLRLPTPQPESFELFLRMPELRQAAFVKGLEAYSSVFDIQLSDFDIERKSSVEVEKKCLEATERNLGLKIHRDVYDQLAEGDVIEIYDIHSIQVYRNINFFRTTNYSLMDVISHPWMNLWDRPRRVTDAINEQVGAIFAAPGVSPVPMDIPVHLLREQAFGKTQIFEIRMKTVAKVLTESGELYGGVSTMRAETIAEGSDALKLGFV